MFGMLALGSRWAKVQCGFHVSCGLSINVNTSWPTSQLHFQIFLKKTSGTYSPWICILYYESLLQENSICFKRKQFWYCKRLLIQHIAIVTTRLQSAFFVNTNCGSYLTFFFCLLNNKSYLRCSFLTMFLVCFFDQNRDEYPLICLLIYLQIWKTRISKNLTY